MNKNKITLEDLDDLCECSVRGCIIEFFDWVAEDVFNITTDDKWVNYVFTKTLLEVMKSIYEEKTFDYIKSSKENYLKFIAICNLFESKDWLEWGSSIRGCWFDYYDGDYYEEKGNLIEYKEIPFTKHNLEVFIKWLENKFKENDYTEEYEEEMNK